jgi:Asp-tRNA(Asn)/Glu-tRNA(Gln) amidotransferase A subunit family amidase
VESDEWRVKSREVFFVYFSSVVVLSAKQEYMNRQSLSELAARLRDGHLSLFDYLDILEAQINGREPKVLAFVPEADRFDRLRQEAANLLAQYPDPATRPPLFGVPVGVKDIFHVDGFPTRAGSRLPAAVLAGEEATSVSALRSAGALILGKTVTTEFAYFAPGPTRHPMSATLGEDYTPGGSSSGSAAAVAAGFCPLALGTQTIGSVIRPAAFCGIVGFKPSLGRVPTTGVIPLSPSVDHVGFFTLTVADAALVAPLLCADWQPYSPLTTHHSPLILGIPEGPYLEWVSAEGLAHFRATCERLAGVGYAVRPVPAMPDFADIVERHNRLVAADAAQVHQQWFAEFGELYHKRTADLIRRGQVVAADDLETARDGRFWLRQQLTDLMDEHSIDFWLSPAAPGPAPKGLDKTGDPVMNLPWTHAGVPAITIPSGTSDNGLPLGLQVVGHFAADEYLLDAAQGIEAVLSG